ncbi:MAG: 50S ribosomal protein L13 [Armatimonadetes bacterium]|nr:50S ribosomal protein L13 [Armatimonadota bacterium]MCX7968328.1 50S ribosomal protein L13 [Armatimonadota bacterium]MDW8142376.1 50S ribosomal protein L13 [Armatimonadota bacterium]
MANKTTWINPKTVERRWWVVDAEGKILGRLASEIARILMGKHKPQWQPNLDIGDFVIVVNAEKVKLTGKKLDQKFHYRHSGRLGNLKAYSYRWMLENRPERVIELAVSKMLPKNRLRARMLKRLKVYRGSNHPHQAQMPQPLSITKTRVPVSAK